MSWSPWPTASTPLPGVIAAQPVQAAVIPGAVNSAPIMNPTANAAMHYTPEQWAQMQQQNWQQWAQWQQQYQQWHQQYGAEYHKSINALATSNPAPPLMETNTSVPPPPPNETKPPPPPPPDDNGVLTPGYMTAPPPPQQYSAPATTNSSTTQGATQWGGSVKRPYVPKQEYESVKRQAVNSPGQWVKSTPPPNVAQAQKAAVNLEELTEAENKFDKEFAAWEAQFNKWKDQNASHPDKTQFLEYEKKWESWRNSLLERREQMRKKRLALQASLPPKPAPVVPQMFNEPPPSVPMYTNQPPQVPAPDMFSKPPPTQNNEPLAFKTNKSVPEEQTQDTDGSDFLKSASPTPGGIPGLDLVKEDVPEEKPEQPKGPDFDAISKGINTILGDSKLMNMLSMVSQKNNSVPEEQYNTNQREIMNNFDDQTQTSFSNAQEGNFGDTYGKFKDEPLRNNYDSNYRDNRRTQYDRYSRDNVNKFSNNMGYNQGRRGNYETQQYSEANSYNKHDESTWNEDEDYDKYHNMFTDGDHNMEQSMHNAPVHGPSGHNVSLRKHPVHNPSMHVPPVHNTPVHNPPMHNPSVHNPPIHTPPVHNLPMHNPPGHNFSVRDPSVHNLPPVLSEPPPVEEEPLFVPQVVIDYEHKPLKEVEPEISLDPIRMFDYRHKNVNRIPHPQRPSWLVAILRNIHKFDPLVVPRRLPAFEREFSYRERESKPRLDERHRDNDKEKFFGGRSSRDGEYGRRHERFDDSPRNRDSRWKSSDSNTQSRDKTDWGHRDQKPLDLEELSDEEWSEDSPKKQIPGSFSPNSEPQNNQNVCPKMIPIEELINAPGRFNRAPKIVIILRGAPGSGKTYLAKLIKDREVENGGSAPRILSLDDYFMVEQEKEVVIDGKMQKIKEMVYEYEEEMEESYRQSLVKSFKKNVTNGFFNFIVVDNVNQKVKNFGEMWSFAKQNGFQVYICELDLDPQLCIRRNIHNRSQKDIEDCIAGWEPTPMHHPKVDATDFMQNVGPITEVEMEEVEQTNDEDNGEVEDHIRSKWDSFDGSLNNLARLDGVNKPLRSSKSMEEYLQLDDEWKEPTEPLKPGQKRVRWADLEEQKQQKKMKAMGFVVGHTDWNRMMDPTNGENALIQTKFIERVRRY